MAVSNDPMRSALVDGSARLSVGELGQLVDGASGVIAASGRSHVVYIGTGGMMLPVLIFGSARAGVPFTPLNYRLSTDSLTRLIQRLPDPLIVLDDGFQEVVTETTDRLITSDEFTGRARSATPANIVADANDVAVVLFTSGTTSTPKAVELTHNNLTSYVVGSVEFASAKQDDVALVCVPPYHIAGVGAAVSNLYAGRSVVYLRQFEPHEWIRLAAAERVTTATVVPTMLNRIVGILERESVPLPSLRNLAYGGSKLPRKLIRRALELLPEVGFVNAYGLTETSSTIAVLTPDDHREAWASDDDTVAQRLYSVGRPLPGVEVEIRGEDGVALGPGERGELFVRSPQVSGRYTGIGSVLDPEGWFPTKDVAMLDDDNYLFIIGRSDDTIIRGGENIAPSEIEDVLLEHSSVRDVAVVGFDDADWGQIIVAVVVAEEENATTEEQLSEFARQRLRGSRTPDKIVFWDRLPTSPTGKVLRREISDNLKSVLGTSDSARETE